MLAHPDVAEAGVTGLVNDEWGQVPIAFIIKKAGTNPSSEELEQFCKEQLGKYKVPKAFYFMEELPRNASKKLLRRELRKVGGSMMTIASVEFYVIQMPLKEPFLTHLGAVTDREGIIIRITNSDGVSGFGEGVAFSTPWYTEETVETSLHMLTSTF